MIELPVQTTFSALPSLPEPAVSGESEAAGFAAQLAQMFDAKPAANGSHLPLPGKILPPVVEPDVPEDPIWEPEGIPLPKLTAPIMPVLPGRIKSTPVADPISVEAPAAESPDQPADEQAAAPLDLPTILVAAPVPTMPTIANEIARHTATLPITSSTEDQGTAPAQPQQAMPIPANGLATSLSADPKASAISERSPSRPNSTAALHRDGARGESAPLAANRPSEPPNTAPDKLLSPLPALALAATQAAKPRETRHRDVADRAASGIELRVASVSLALGEFPLPKLVAADVQGPLLAPGASFQSAGPTAAPATPSTTAPTPAPQDFAALIDRIVAAREASGAPVAVAVRHAEFGAVNLRFEQAESGISVLATSPDPDFARAAAAAAPAERAHSFDQAPRDSGRAAAQHEPQGQAGGSNQHRQSSAALNNASSQDRSVPPPDSEARDSAIFA